VAGLLAAAAAMAMPAAIVHAGGPIQVANVAAGTAAFAQAGHVTTITAANNTIINYQRFDIPHGNTVDFVQPSATARVLNRIIGPSPTQIDGNLNANGVVYFVNPAGVMFGQGAVINVGQLYAAAGHLSDANFLSGINSFTDNTGAVINNGVIHASDVTFAAQNITNNGTILTPQGMMVMAAGKDVYVSKLGSPFLVQVAGRGKTGTTGVTNSGTMDATGGDVAIRAGDMYSLAINTTGTIQAAHISVKAKGTDSTVLVSGNLDAADQGAHSTGGTITVNGGNIGIGVTADAAGHFRNATATLIAAGTSGGGKILIGVKPDTASATGYSDASQYDFIGALALLNASATVHGDGGLVDTSGQVLQVSPGAVITAAGAGGGAGGQWLLDPRNVTINTGTNTNISGTGTNPETFKPSATGAILNTGTLDSALQSNTGVIIDTTGTGSDAGYIAVASPINPVLTTSTALTLNATSGIDIEQSIAPGTGSAASSELSLVLNAGGNLTSGPGNGSAIYINAPINTNGGNFTATVSGGTTLNFTLNNVLTGTNLSSNNGGIVSINSSGTAVVSSAGSINVNGNTASTTGGGNAGAITIIGSTGVTIDGNLSAAGGNSTASGSTGGPGGGILISSASGNITLAGVTITTTGGNDNSTSDGGGGGVGIDATGTGAISLTGVTINTSSQGVGGAGAIAVYSSTGTIAITGSTFNSSGAGGGAAGIQTAADVTLSGINSITTSGSTGATAGGGGGISGTATSLVVGGGSGNGGAGNGGGISGGIASAGSSSPNSSAGGSTSGGISGGGAPGAAGALAVTGSGTVQSITVNGPITGSAGAAVFTSPTINLNASISSPSSVTGSGVNLVAVGSSGSYQGDIQQGVSLLASGGTLDLTALAGTTSSDNVIFSLPIKIVGPTTGSVTAASWAASINTAAVTLSGDFAASATTGNGFDFLGTTTISGTATLTSTNSAQNFGGTITLGSQTLTLDGTDLTASGSPAFSGSTGTLNLGLTTPGVSVNSFSGVGTLNFTTPFTFAVGQTLVGASGTTTFQAAVTLDGANTIDTAASGGSVVFASTLNASTTADSLTIGTSSVLEAATFDQNVGATLAPVSLTVNGTTTLDGNVTTTGVQSYTGAVTLGANAQLVANSTNTNSGSAATVTFGSTITGGGFGLTIGNTSGPVLTNAIFDGDVAGVSALDVTGTTLLDGNITTSGAQSYTGAVTLEAATQLVANSTNTNSGSAATVTFGSTITGGGFGLTIGNTTGPVMTNAIFDGDVAGVSVLDVTGTTLLDGNITTSGAQSYTGAVTLGANAQLVANSTNTNSGSAATVTFGSTIAGGGFGLTLGNTTGPVMTNAIFDGDVAGVSALDVTGTTLLDGNITTSGAQSYTGAVTLEAATQLVANSTNTNSGTAATVAFGSTIAGGGFGLTIGNTSGPVLTNAIFAGDVTGVSALDVTGTTGMNTAAISTTAGQTYGGIMTLGKPSTTLTDNSTIGISTHQITGTSADSLTIDETGAGSTTIGGIVSSLGTLTIDTGGNITLDGNITANTVSMVSAAGSHPLSVPSAIVIQADTQNYSVDAINAVLGLSALSKLTLADTTGTAAPSSLTIIQEASISDADLPLLTASTGSSVNDMSYTVKSLDGNISLAGGAISPVAGANLTLDAPAGSITLGSGGSLNVESLTAASVGTGAITLNNDVTTTGAQTYQGPVELGAAITLTTTSGAVDFASNINGNSALSINSGGLVTFGSAVGGTARLASLTVTGVGSPAIDINGTAIATTGNQTYNSAVSLGNSATSLTTTTGAVDFASTLNGNSDLTIGGGGLVTFGGAVGGTASLASLSVTGVGTPAIDINGATIATSGNQTYNSPLTLNASFITLSTTNGGSIAMTSVTGHGDSLTVTTTGAGGITVTGTLDTSGSAGSTGSYGGIFTTGGTGGTGGSGGIISMASGSGAISLANVNTSGGIGGGGGESFVSGGGSGGNGGNAGTINISSSSGSITVGNIIADGGTGGSGGFGVPNGANGIAGSSAAISLTAATGGMSLNAGAGNPITISGMAETLGGPVTLSGDTTLSGSTLNSSTSGLAIAGGGYSLTLNLTASGNLGTMTNLSSLAANGPGPYTLNGSIGTSGNQTYAGDVLLGGNITLAAAAAAGVTFAGTVDNATPAAEALTITGDATFSAGVGQGIHGGLASVSVSGTTILNANVTTTGNQTYTGDVTLLDSGSAKIFTILAGTNTVGFGATISGTSAGLDTLNIGNNSTATNASFASAVGAAATPLSALTVYGTTRLGGNVFTTAGQIYSQAVTLDHDLALTDASAGGVFFGGTVDNASAATAESLNITGNATFTAGVGQGGNDGLASVTVSGTTAINGNITTIGNQTYTGNVTLLDSGAAKTMTLLAGTNVITFGGTVDGTTHDMDILNIGDITNATNASFASTVGSAAIRLSALSVYGTASLGGDVTTSGQQTYAGGVTVNTSLTLTGSDLNPSPALPAVFTGSGSTTPALTLNFSNSCNINLPDSTGLGSLDLANATAPFSITQSATLTYPLIVAGPVTVSGNTAIALDGPSFTFQNTLNAANGSTAGLMIGEYNGGGGNAEIDGAVGAIHPLGSLTIAGTSVINGGAVTTIGEQTYTGAVTIGGGGTTIFTSSAGGIEEDGGMSDALGGITLAPSSALMVPNPDSLLGGAISGDFRPQSYLTINGSISAPNGTITLAPLQPTYNGSIMYNGQTVIPDAATIITTVAIPGQLITVSGANVTMGMDQKWTSLTSLTIAADGVLGIPGVAKLGDLNVAGTLTVNASTIDMLLRPAGSQLLAGVPPQAFGLHINTTGQEGVDVVADTINFSSLPVGYPSGAAGLAPQFASGIVGGFNFSSAGQHYYGTSITASTLTATGDVNGAVTTYYLDLKATGPATSNVANTVVPIVPPPIPQVTSVVVLSSAQRQILREAGINARNTSIDNLLNLFGGKAVFNDIPTSDGMIIVHPTLLDYYVTTSRLPYQQTKDFIAMYRALFLAPAINPKTHQPELDKDGNPIYRSRRTKLHVLFRDAFNRYSKAVGAAHTTALGFRLWLEKTPAQHEALRTLNQLRVLLSQVRRLGLTSVELRLSHSTILAELNPAALSERQFEETVLGRRLIHL
jgi:filamentous hemagglutinin family protein